MAVSYFTLPNLKQGLMFAGTFFTRYDYENVDSAGAQKLVDGFAVKVADKSFIGSTVSGRKVTDAGNFGYIDPVDGSVSKNQGLFARFDDGSRIVVRLSGTGSSGATVRLYLEKHELVRFFSIYNPLVRDISLTMYALQDENKHALDAQVYLEQNIKLAVDFLGFQGFVGRTVPDVRT